MLQRERALLTGMFAVRNHIATRLEEYAEDGFLSRLKSLRTPQVYVHRLIDKAPGESESLMIAVMELGLKLDSLLAHVDQAPPAVAMKVGLPWHNDLGVHITELLASLEQFDAMSLGHLDFVTEEDLARWGIQESGRAPG